MSELTQRDRVVQLIRYYLPLLTDKQKELVSSYYEFDLSYSEIAAEGGVSRAAVEDGIKKSIKKMEEYESKLHLIELVSKENELLEKIEKDPSAEAIARLKEIINNGI